MILSFGPPGDGAVAAGLAFGLPTVCALLAYAVAALPGERSASLLRSALLVGWIAHGIAIAVDVAGIGSVTSGARFGFAPALSATLWLVLGVYQLEARVVPLPGARRKLALLGVAVVALAWCFPGRLHPNVGSPWAPLHWMLGLASYGLFGVAVLHAALLDRAERQLRGNPAAPVLAAPAPPVEGIPLLRLERLTFRFVTAGFAMLSAALVFGAVFAHPWRWDHKTVFSLLGWLVFAALVIGRYRFGWRGIKATRWLYAGALLLLLAYVGSRFVLEVLLHRGPTGG
ncbi:cytochrome C assembly family protein [Piscinibacter koreensis]|uniref:Cytochrome c biogenesis protein CcsA n=1 Tax=Piscinibacter koreensis TaxID=2742824 RepID=A0A7Y6NM33_9BURK|nr:cytochrome c biogenesis protein CcsA [Schlegelella koreensis]NUZ05693.1 cytochrome c biogenesis protein CcsA [Schlegelella koreensis]